MSVNRPAFPDSEPAAVSASAPRQLLCQFIGFTVAPSVNLWRGQILLHVLLAVLMIWALLPWIARAWYWLPVLCGSLMGLFIHYRLTSKQWLGNAGHLLFSAGEWWWQAEATQPRIALQLTRAALVWPFLIVLPFRKEDRDFTLILLSDSLAAEDLRRLRVCLRTFPSQPRGKK